MNGPGEDEAPAKGRPPVGILPGGCLPPGRWPDDDDYGELGSSDLDSEIDWMTWDHRRLYAMATQGLDVPGANTVAAKWGDLGVLLQDIAEDLARALRRSEQGWEGSAAELARTTAEGMAGWAEDTAHRAHAAGTCVSRQAEIALRAAHAMPEPVESPEIVPFCGTPSVNQGGGSPPLDGTTAMSAGGSPFVSQDVSSAGRLAHNPWGSIAEARAAHQQAAEVMQKMQHESAEVYSTVPSFAPPKQYRLPIDRQPYDDGKKKRRPSPENPPKSETTTSSTPGAAAPAVGGVVGGSVGGGPADGPRFGAGSQAGVHAANPGGSAGVAPPPAAASAAASAAGGAGRGMGAMPMGAMGGAGAGGRSEDKTHKRNSPLDGERVFDPDDETIHRRLLGEQADEPPRRRR